MPYLMELEYIDTPKRRVLDLEKAGVQGIPAIGLSRLVQAHEAVEEHIHRNALEFGLCLRGALSLSLLGEDYPIMPGCAFANPPGVRHRLTAQPRGLFLYWMHVRASGARRLRRRLRQPAISERGAAARLRNAASSKQQAAAKPPFRRLRFAGCGFPGEGPQARQSSIRARGPSPGNLRSARAALPPRKPPLLRRESGCKSGWTGGG